jgi:DtxR family Mn-dependent transcriptional regulator
MDKKIQHTHDHDLSHSMVHYLLTIHKLKELNGYARVTDIAKDLQITKGSVSTAVNNLKKRDLVIEDSAKFLSLSEKGHFEVHRILTSRTLLFYFLKDVIGVDDEVAHKDSCLMEHLLSDETRNKFFEFLKLICSKQELQFNLSINLSKYSGLSDFLKDQKGDSYLKTN